MWLGRYAGTPITYSGMMSLFWKPAWGRNLAAVPKTDITALNADADGTVTHSFFLVRRSPCLIDSLARN